MPYTPLRNLKPQLFNNEYETDSDDTDSEGRWYLTSNFVFVQFWQRHEMAFI